MNLRRRWELYRLRRLLGDDFDAGFYLERNPDVANAGLDPLGHYVKYGWREARDPSPCFDTDYYLASYPDVARSGINPLLHFVRHGRGEGRKPKMAASATEVQPDRAAVRAAVEDVIRPYFDGAYYLATYHDVREAGLDPLKHYLKWGWREGRQPTPDFSTSFYLQDNPDVASSDLNPFEHYVLFGEAEGRASSSPIIDLLALKPVQQAWQPSGRFRSDLEMSVVIPTYNRAKMLPKLLDSWRDVHRHTRYSYELLFSDDGSSDDTLEVLERASHDLPITILRNEHGGASSARNAAIACARGAKILFLGDDIYPDPYIINRHIEKLRELPITDAVLGECGWHPDLAVNHLMKHITEIGCEQFSFLHLPRNGFTDFRHFYTCNVSIDREFLLSEPVLFDESFYKYGFEDVELGYRLARKGMRIFYLPEAWGDHLHSYADVRKFCVRQESAGEMARVFERQHPELGHIIPLAAWREAWERRVQTRRGRSFDVYGQLEAIAQACEARHSELDPPLLDSLSRLYSRLFAFSFEMGYARAVVDGVTDPVIQSAAVELVLDQALINELLKLHDRLKLDLVDVLLGVLNQPERCYAAPIIGGKVSPRAGANAVIGLVVEAEDLAHLAQLQVAYRDAFAPVTYALRSDTPTPGMVYRPGRGSFINLANLQQLQLFVEVNPNIGQIVLSFGLHDGSAIGLASDGATRVIRRAGANKFGKVIRIFGEDEGDVIPFETLFGGHARLLDSYGYFEGQTDV